MTLLTILLLALATYACGWATLALFFAKRPSEIHPNPLFLLILRYALGLGVLSSIAFFLLAWRVFSPAVAVALLVLLAVAGICALVRTRRDFSFHPQFLSSPLDLVAFAAFIAASAFLVLCAWSPDLSIDAYSYHVPVTKQWFLQRRLVDLPYNLMCHYHMLIDVSKVWAYVFDLNDFLPTKLREVVSSIAVAALLAIELRRRLGRASGWFAALAWLLFPETIETGITNYIDMSLGLYFLATMVVLSRTLEPGRRRARKFALAGVLIGMLIGTKITGYYFTALLIAAWIGARMLPRPRFCLRTLSRLRAAVLRPLILIVAGAVLFAAPWPIKNTIVVGNPFFPFATSIFPIRPDLEQPAQAFHERHVSTSPIVLVQSIRLFAANTRYLELNRLICALVLLLLFSALRHAWPPGRSARFLIFLAVVFLPLILRVTEERLFFGPIALHLVVAILLFDRLTRLALAAHPRARQLGSIVLALLILASLVPAGWKMARVTTHPFEYRSFHHYLTREDRELHYFSSMYRWKLAQFVNRTLQPGELVLATERLQLLAWIDVPAIPNSREFRDSTLQYIALESGGGTPESIARRLRELGVTHVLSSPALETNPVVHQFQREYLTVLCAEEGVEFSWLGP